MNEYDDECLVAFLQNQEQLFDQPVAETIPEAEAFLEDCLAVIVDSVEDVTNYLEESGMDITGLSEDDILETPEVFAIPDGRFLIVEG